jgi:hypothetical protein
MFRVCRQARAAASAAAASAGSDEEAVTCEDAMDRMAWRTPAVNDSSSAVTRAWFLRRASDLGVTHFDLANNYGQHRPMTTLRRGRLIWRRPG